MNNAPPTFKRVDLEQKFGELLMVAEFCLQVRAVTPALILIYSAIDVAGWLSTANASVKPSAKFNAWVNKYMLADQKKLGCSALELFGARCGLVHNFAAQSDLSRSFKVREILYVWGNEDVDLLREMSSVANQQIPGRPRTVRYTELRVEDLLMAFRQGLQRFFDDSRSDPRLAARLAERAGKVLSTVSREELFALKAWIDRRINETRGET